MLWKLVFLAFLSFWTPAYASTPGTSAADEGVALKKKSKEEQQEEISDAEKEAERKRKEKLARVIVLKWPDTSTDYKDETVRRNVKSRIARPDALFFPEVDLYQNGRKVKDRTVVPAMQPAIVPTANKAVVMDAVDDIASVPWNAKRPEEWGLKAQELLALSEQLWFVDRVELREPMFLLYAQIGRAAENQNFAAPPFYEQIGNFAVNYYFYLAATLAYQEPALMSKLTDQELNASIGVYLGQLQQGAFPTLKVDFEQENQYDETEFNNDYEVLVNGLPVEIDSNAQIDAFAGRTDIYLKRKDAGHGLSERLEVAKLDDKFYFVRDVARKRMGIDFIQQLFLHKNECVPEVDGDILNYLAIYQKLHEKAEVYIAVPETGNPNKVWIWRYDRNSAQLNLVGGGPDGFPVRFALVSSVGLLFNGAQVTVDTSLDAGEAEATQDVGNFTTADGLRSRVDKDLKNAAIPVTFALRGHYNRLMVELGAEFGYNSDDDGLWVERYYLPKHQSEYDTIVARPGGDDGVDSNGDPVEAYHYTEWNRYMYMGVGVVLGRDAGLGFGPRFALKSGWTNLPHAWQTTGHFGWAYQPPIGEFGGRFRPLVDADFRGGVSLAAKNSLQRDIASDETLDEEGIVMPVFGLTAGIGFTF